MIGYTEYRTDLPGGRWANEITMRAGVVGADGAGRRALAGELTREPHTWTQFSGWSPDGRLAVIGQGWESPENGAWEEEHHNFRFTPEGWRYDMHLLDLDSGRAENLTAIERVSFYNTGLFFWPGDPQRLGFQALINGISHPFSMDRDGRNKRDLSQGPEGFAYGFSASPDGWRIAYHKAYQIHLADADGGNLLQVRTGNPFNFVPQWSPGGDWLLFLSGEHYDCHPHLVRPDGTGLRQLAGRNGYRGVVEFLDVPDFHGGSSDVPIWSPDGEWVYFTARMGQSVELMRVSVNGQVERLTHSAPGTLHYHPQVSPDACRLVYGSKRQGQRQLYVMDLETRCEHPVTQLGQGWGAMWAHWQRQG